MTVAVAVLGRGQLGWMLGRVADRLGVELQLLDPANPALPADNTQVTVESEHWPDNEGVRALQRHPGWRNARTLSLLPDRRRQKELLDSLQLPTAPWCIPGQNDDLDSLRARLGEHFLLKSARGGYDGRGQHRVAPGSSDPLPDWKDNAIAEAMIPFETEVSLVGARASDGHCVFYRLTENRHRSGILTVSLSQPDRFAHWQSRAEAMLGKIMDHLDYVGVMAMECFVQGEQLLINELAPRVHNSGHWTQAGASICQFELHLRALVDLPLPAPVQSGVTAMVNLIGLDWQAQWLAVPGARLYWYGKELQPGRKMGHINLHHTDPQQVAEWLDALALPEDYRESLAWARERLAGAP